MKKHGCRQVQIAEKANVTQATVSRIISTNQALDDNVAKALCSCWPSRADNIQMLIAGLCDVIRRWGFDPDADVEITPNDAVAKTISTQADIDLESIRTHMADDVVADLVHDLAVILRRADHCRTYKEHPDRSALGSGSAAEPKPTA